MIQAQRKEEENGFASCLLWGRVASGAEDSSAGGGAFLLHLPFHLTAKLKAAAVSFRKRGKACLKGPTNTPPLLVYIYTNPIFLKQLFKKITILFHDIIISAFAGF